MNESELLTFLEKEGYQNLKVLEDGTLVGTENLIFSTALYVGLTEFSYKKRYIFETEKKALTALNLLKAGWEEPAGYVQRLPPVGAD